MFKFCFRYFNVPKQKLNNTKLLQWLAKISRNKDKVEVQLTILKLNPSSRVFETKINSVRESSLSEDCMALVQSTCSYLRQRNLCTRVVQSVLLRTLCVPGKLVDKGKVGSRSVIVEVFHLF